MNQEDRVVQKIPKSLRIKQVFSIIGILVLVAGLSTGVALVQQQQDIREKAEGPTCSPIGGCGAAGGCPNGYRCSSTGKCVLDNNCNICPNTDCNIPSGTSGAIKCVLSTDTSNSTYCCPASKPLYDVNSKTCKTSSGSGNDNDNDNAACSSASAASCQGKDPGDSCKGGVCTALKQEGNDGKQKCSCKSESDDSDSDDSTWVDNNPTKIGPFTSSGEVHIFFQPKDYKIKIALKKNSDSCNFTDYDALLESPNFSSTGEIATGINVESGDYLCIYIEDIGTDTSQSYPCHGWIEPENNQCGAGEFEKMDISSLVSQVSSAGLSAFSTQCWGDYGQEEDYEDFALIFAVSSSSSSRASLCSNLSVSKTSSSITLTSTAKESVNNFVYALYNNDNLYSANNPKPICVTSGGDIVSETSACPTGSYHLIFKDGDTSSRTTGTKTLSYSNVFVADKNNSDKTANSVHVVAYFSTTGGASSIPEGACIADITSDASDLVSEGNMAILFRLQGITKEKGEQSFSITIKEGNNTVAEFSDVLAPADSNGVFTATINTSSFCSNTETFDVLVKGESHLAKKFEDVGIGCSGVVLDKSTSTGNELKAGDVNGDNLITIEDLAKVLSYYTTFSTPVTSGMESSDINKDGDITIIDVALVALNWSDFVISGDE